MSIRLVVAGPSGEQVIDRDRYGTLLVGRSEEAQICVAKDRHFSRRHCWIELAPPQAKVVDLKSHNGTFLNGQRIDAAWLKHGDVISGGQTAIKVTIPAEGAEKTLTLASPPPQANLPRTAPLARGGDLPEPAGAAQRFGRYEIIAEAGRGAMGVVYAARHGITRQVVALKVIVPMRAVSEKQVQLFLREASMMSTLVHKRIVKLLEIGVDAGRLFLAMEFVEHRSFDEWSRGMPRWRQIRLACGVAAQTLETLDYAHGRGVVHRDVKPENLLLSEVAGRLAVRVADFGLAKSYIESGFSGITESGDVRGTLGFMPPEQLIDSRKAHPVSDLFSVGATLYFLLTGQFLYDVQEGEDPIRVILSEPPTPIEQRVNDLPEELAALVTRAIAPEPERRFSSAGEMRKWIEPFLRKPSP